MFRVVAVSVCVYASSVFVQAEGGIRALVRSRGLGDVYKRQVLRREQATGATARGEHLEDSIEAIALDLDKLLGPVSYTHLTLPTSDLV